MRICFFGDSFVNGTGDDEGLGWVGRVVARARQDGRDVTGYNLGIRANTSADVAARWAGEARLRIFLASTSMSSWRIGTTTRRPSSGHPKSNPLMLIIGRPRSEYVAPGAVL